jgi:hypothetical protein
MKGPLQKEGVSDTYSPDSAQPFIPVTGCRPHRNRFLSPTTTGTHGGRWHADGSRLDSHCLAGFLSAPPYIPHNQTLRNIF